MPDRALRDCRVLVAEDEYMLADELQTHLEDAGAIVVGPVGNLSAATAVIAVQQRIDAAILDANLGGELVYPAAHLLIKRGVPIVFTTGYDGALIPSRFSAIARYERPVSMPTILQAIGRVMQG